ncbi:hypothetical protein CYLTODRAFT_62898 [Cylindrobasidium torrendii FP15055 ss-10]|uniref:Uncharacterized protein n=1 Tax=Cylindrobasidium torrendii FP15055 ss-10 TaxID=1314674 RepID=A0A0D7BRA3_9AGAR|nr:hypothetical protein CYLTODRAFT_62898 [Cylindrobasidium torrendii FP15055 ss-10]
MKLPTHSAIPDGPMHPNACWISPLPLSSKSTMFQKSTNSGSRFLWVFLLSCPSLVVARSFSASSNIFSLFRLNNLTHCFRWPKQFCESMQLDGRVYDLPKMQHGHKWLSQQATTCPSRSSVSTSQCPEARQGYFHLCRRPRDPAMHCVCSSLLSGSRWQDYELDRFLSLAVWPQSAVLA